MPFLPCKTTLTYRTHQAAKRLALPLLLGLAAASPPAAATVAPDCVSGVAYTTVGANDCKVPSGVTSMTVVAVGGGGGGGSATLGGSGARVTVTNFAVTPLNTLTMYVGGGGSGGGGGSSNVNAGTATQIIAGGGGGGGTGSTKAGAGGAAGSLSDGSGSPGGDADLSTGGGGGSGGSGGSAGSSNNSNGVSGTSGNGGPGAVSLAFTSQTNTGLGAGTGSGGKGGWLAGGGGGGYGGGGGGGYSQVVIQFYGGGGGGGGSVGPTTGGASTAYSTASNGGAASNRKGGNGSITLTFTLPTTQAITCGTDPGTLTSLSTGASLPTATVTATPSAGNTAGAPTYAANVPGVCSASANGALTISGAGTCNYTVDAPATATVLNAATQKSCSVVISQGYTVTGVASPPAGGTVNCTSPVAIGTASTCTYSANSGYVYQSNRDTCAQFVGTFAPGDFAKVAALTTYNTAAVSQNCTSTALFTPIVNGACGSANGVTTLLAPTANLCATGTASTVTNNTSNYSWSCNGTNGGTTASCSAPKQSLLGNTVGGTPFTGTTVPATGTGGTATANFTTTTGGATCQFDAANTAFVASVPYPAAGSTTPHGAFKFKMIGCNSGFSALVTVTWPSSLNGMTVKKYGKATSTATVPTFFDIPGVQQTGNSVTYTVTDGQLGDDDWTPDGVIIDPIEPVLLPSATPTSIPTLNEWMLALLAMMLMGLAARQVRRRL